MRRLFAKGGEAVIHEVPPPTLRHGEVLVETAWSTTSRGTETHILERSAIPGVRDEEYPGERAWPHPRLRAGVDVPLAPRPPVPGLMSLGYSLAGRILEVGEGISDLAVGDLVACSGSQCAHHAEIVAVPRNLTARLPDGLSLQQAAFGTLGSIAEESVRRTECHFGETVVVYGLGILGVLAAQIARFAGLTVIGLEVDAERLALARSLGFDDVHDPTTIDPVAHVREATDGFGADAVILGVVTESSEPLNQALRMSRQRGRVVSLGIFGMHIERGNMFDRALVHSLAYGPGRYDPGYEEGNADMPIGLVRWTENRNLQHVLKLMTAGVLVTDGLARTVPFAEAPAAYREMRGARGLPLTLQLDYGRGAVG